MIANLIALLITTVAVPVIGLTIMALIFTAIGLGHLWNDFLDRL